MTYAATVAALSADLAPLEGVESILVRLMARAHAAAEACFDRAEGAEDAVRRDAELRLAAQLGTAFIRALGALHRHRAQTREERKAAAKNGIKSVQKNCGTDKRFDRRTAKNGKPYFCLCAANGEVIGRSEMYSGHSGRNNGIASVKRNAPGASVVDES